MALCPLYGYTLSSLQPSVLSSSLFIFFSPLFSSALCPLNGPLFPLRLSVPSAALCVLSKVLGPRYGPLSSALCLLYSHLSPLQPYVPHYDTLYPLWPYVTSKVLCYLYGPLHHHGPMSPLLPFVPYTVLCHLYDLLSSQWPLPSL
jgi:hypothetical protein